ncbi:MAG: preprotein translocase subunit SecE [Campylobacter sp.]|nr:preprotein translocase subunit SecE [Campylobacter sp.]
MEKVKEYYSQSKSELDKVIFLTKEQTRNAYVAVIVVVFVIALFLALVDAIMSGLISAS